MPRRRTIACQNCGHLVRKRDDECEVCGATTARAETRMNFAFAKFGVMGLVVIGFVIYMRAVIAGIGS